MKILVALLISVVMMMIPTASAGLKCVVCMGKANGTLGYYGVSVVAFDLPCSGYKKGDSKYHVDCDELVPTPREWLCIGSKKNEYASGCVEKEHSIAKAGDCQISESGFTLCACDKDFCNRSTKAGGGSSWVGIVLISLGGLIFRQIHANFSRNY